VISEHRYTYSKDGQIATWQRSYDAASGLPAVTDRFDYDLADRLLSSVVKNTASGAVLKESQFIQDPADNLTSARESNRLRSASYNSVNQQLTESAGGKVRITGTINKPGATITLAGAPAAVHPQGGFAAEVTAAQGANHFPLVVTEANGTVTTRYVDLQVENGVPMIYAYDLNGNLTSIAPQATPAVPTRTYQWDAADRLVGITRIISPTETRKTELLYNGMGSRVGKTELLNGAVQTSIKYQYGEIGVLQERSADGGTVLKIYTSQGEQLYTFVNNQTSITNRYYTRDHLGSVREVVTSTGAVFVRYDYTPYGERSRVAGSFATFEAEKGYTGHDYLVDSGLILTRFRAYDPRTARWLSADPIGERGGMNLYGYVLGDPVNRWDPTGKNLVIVGAAVVVTVIVYGLWKGFNYARSAQKKLDSCEQKQLKNIENLENGEELGDDGSKDLQGACKDLGNAASSIPGQFKDGGPAGLPSDKLDAGLSILDTITKIIYGGY
jgi:RHS repeat-associated protein